MPSSPSYAVDGFETSGRDEPSSGIGWYAVARPLFDRDSKGFMQRLFGSFKIAEETDQGCKHLARLSLVDCFHRLAHMFRGILAHGRQAFTLKQAARSLWLCARRVLSLEEAASLPCAENGSAGAFSCPGTSRSTL